MNCFKSKSEKVKPLKSGKKVSVHKVSDVISENIEISVFEVTFHCICNIIYIFAGFLLGAIRGHSNNT